MSMIGSAVTPVARRGRAAATLEADRNSRRDGSAALHPRLVFCTMSALRSRWCQPDSSRLFLIAWRSLLPPHGFRARPAIAPGRRAFRQVPAESPPLSPDEALKTFHMPPGYHVELVASEPLDPGAGRDRLGHRGPALGGRDARLHGRHHRLERTRPDRPRRRAGRHRRRRQDGQAHGVRRRPRPGAIGQGARPRRARRRAAECLADARHERRPAHGHERARHQPVRPAGRRSSEQRQRLPLGARQPDAHRRAGRHPASAEERRLRGPEDAAARRVGRDAGRCGTHLPQHERIGAARRSGAHGVLRAQSESAAHARQLRAARRRQRSRR